MPLLSCIESCPSMHLHPCVFQCRKLTENYIYTTPLWMQRLFGIRSNFVIFDTAWPSCAKLKTSNRICRGREVLMNAARNRPPYMRMQLCNFFIRTPMECRQLIQRNCYPWKISPRSKSMRYINCWTGFNSLSRTNIYWSRLVQQTGICGEPRGRFNSNAYAPWMRLSLKHLVNQVWYSTIIWIFSITASTESHGKYA